jgi:hypothetical protein
MRGIWIEKYSSWGGESDWTYIISIMKNIVFGEFFRRPFKYVVSNTIIRKDLMTEEAANDHGDVIYSCFLPEEE